jgi:hypothetical protein
MRRLLAVVLIIIAAGAHAASPPKHITVVAQPALRQAATAPAAAPVAPMASTAPPAAWIQPGVSASACRQTCAQTRYFCEADPNADDCGAAWGQCVAACSAPNLNAASAAAAGN